jgi:hypothetical protein
VRKVLLLAALAMAATLVFTPVAMAQADLDCPQLSEAEEQAVFSMDPSDPNGLDANDNGVPCEDDTTDDGSFALPEETTMMEEPTTVEPTTVEPTTVEPTTVEPTTVELTTVSPAPADQYTATPVPLPATGGASPEVALASLALLLGGGVLAFAIVRRN